MALKSDYYMIFSKIDGAPIGRSVLEECAPEQAGAWPKKIYKLPKDTKHDMFDWRVEKLENGNYKLFVARWGRVAPLDGLPMAIVLFNEQRLRDAPLEWTLERDERDTEGNAYVVRPAGSQDGWVAPTGDYENLVLKPVLGGSTNPPTFSPSEVFVFKPERDVRRPF